MMLTAIFALTALVGAELDAKVASVMPSPKEERWLAIPWRLDLMQARVEAQRLHKPLFLWIMNGHPMGCT